VGSLKPFNKTFTAVSGANATYLQPPGQPQVTLCPSRAISTPAISANVLPSRITLVTLQAVQKTGSPLRASSRDLAKFTDVRRYASLVCIISEARAILIDEVIDLHERILGSLFSRAKRTQAERLQQTES
jgi:hypothetical protein